MASLLRRDHCLEVSTVLDCLWHGTCSGTVRASSSLFDHGTTLAHNHLHGVFTDLWHSSKASTPYFVQQTGIVVAYTVCIRCLIDWVLFRLYNDAIDVLVFCLRSLATPKPTINGISANRSNAFLHSGIAPSLSFTLQCLVKHDAYGAWRPLKCQLPLAPRRQYWRTAFLGRA